MTPVMGYGIRGKFRRRTETLEAQRNHPEVRARVQALIEATAKELSVRRDQKS